VRRSSDHTWRTGCRAWWHGCVDCRGAEVAVEAATRTFCSSEQTLSASKTKFDTNRDEGHRRPASTRCDLPDRYGRAAGARDDASIPYRATAWSIADRRTIAARKAITSTSTTNSASSMQTWTNSQPMPRTALRVHPRKAAAGQPLLWYCLGGFAVTRISANPFYLAPLRFSCAAGLFRAGWSVSDTATNAPAPR
jgi:hypothetical protein